MKKETFVHTGDYLALRCAVCFDVLLPYKLYIHVKLHNFRYETQNDQNYEFHSQLQFSHFAAAYKMLESQNKCIRLPKNGHFVEWPIENMYSYSSFVIIFVSMFQYHVVSYRIVSPIYLLTSILKTDFKFVRLLAFQFTL